MKENEIVYSNDKKLLNALEKNKVKCECGHTLYIVNKPGRRECNYCHKLVFKDEATKFKYIMKRKLIRERRRLNEI